MAKIAITFDEVWHMSLKFAMVKEQSSAQLKVITEDVFDDQKLSTTHALNIISDQMSFVNDTSNDKIISTNKFNN